MKSRTKLRDLQEAERKRREAKNMLREVADRFGSRTPARKRAQSPRAPESAKPGPEKNEPPTPKLISRVQRSVIPFTRDGEMEPRTPSNALVELSDMYLHAAEHRTRHIALVWPATLKTLTLVHALATVARWCDGDKQGVRGLMFPVKTNVFYPLNHICFDRAAVLQIASELVEVQGSHNPRVTRSLPDKDAFLYSLRADSLSAVEAELPNPTVGELLPHFLATPGFTEWKPCTERLLSLIRTKLLKRSQAKALKDLNCALIGDPRSAPDALFALDGRMSKREVRAATQALAKLNPPEVVLVVATRAVRFDARSWKARIAHFCIMLEDVFRGRPPGVVIITDEPYAAYKLKDELWKRDNSREPDERWRSPHEFAIRGVPSIAPLDGLLPATKTVSQHPMPRQFDVFVVDADVAKIANKLVRLANGAPGGREVATPLTDAAGYLSRMGALPCGVRHLSEYLAGPDIAQHTRDAFDWPMKIGTMQEFERTVGLGEGRSTLMSCIDEASRLVENYYEATPFAHKLAELVAIAAKGRRKQVAIVFTGSLYRRLAERFLSEYTQYPEGACFKDFQDRVYLLSAAHLEEHLSGLDGSKLVFAGLNEECLRLLVTDDRVPAHSAVLLTQRAGQFLRTSLTPFVERFPEFKAFKPRIESILRQLKDLREDSSVMSTGDYVLPTFRVELSSHMSSESDEADLDSWAIRLDNGATQYRRERSEVYVYDPASQYSSERGFRTCQVRSLEIGDKLFVMSGELREMVEQVLRDAGVAIQSDKTFEGALRNYHEMVQQRLANRFPSGTRSEKVRGMRKEMLAIDPGLEEHLPQEQAMGHWIDLGDSPNTPFEKLRPQAPLREAIFRAFAQVLGLSPLEAAYYWQRVIMAVRNSRRLDGRHISDIYAYMLLQPESALANSSIKRHTLMHLFDKARDSVATVEAVGPIAEQKT